MHLDVATLTFAEAIISFACGMFMLLHWWQNRAAFAALWWAAASCGIGAGITLLALQPVLPLYASEIIGPLILNGSAAATWIAALAFNRGTVKAVPILSLLGGWAASLALVGALGGQRVAPAFGISTGALFYAAAGVEFWLGRRERLRGRWPMIYLLGQQAAALFLGGIDFATSAHLLEMPELGWFGVVHFAELIYAVGSAISLVTMLKERTEAKHRQAALTDPLTGLANRRAFMERAERVFNRCQQNAKPVTILAFDLDNFKRINDTFGHPTGDDVLRGFGNLLSRMLRPSDLVARLGGEEFGAILPNCDLQVALAIAGRIRSAFQEEARFMNGRAIGATVSVGIATAAADQSLMETIASADDALYRAKNSGRNRVAVSERNYPAQNGANVVRIA
jgi:diguanylate cyclase (GGDEF)-like protein